MRTRYTLINMAVNIGGQLFNQVLLFISRMVFIHYLSAAYLGVNGLFTDVLGMLNLAELGIGTAMIFSLYEPAAKDDKRKLAQLMNLYKILYRVVAGIVLLVGLALMPFLGFFIKDSVEVVELPEFEPDVAEAELGRLLELFRDGLSRPLPLAAYFSSACSAKDEPEAKRRAALAKFDPGPFDFPLDNLEGFHRCFRPEDFNDEAFLELVFRCADLIYPKQPQEVQQ